MRCHQVRNHFQLLRDCRTELPAPDGMLMDLLMEPEMVNAVELQLSRQLLGTVDFKPFHATKE